MGTLPIYRGVLFVCIISFLTFIIVGCGKMTDEQKKELKAAVVEITDLKAELEIVKKEFESGSLTAEQFKVTFSKVSDALKNAQDTVEKIKSSGNASTLEMIGYSVGAAILGQFGLARGLPSKGPLAFIRRGFGGSVREKEISVKKTK